MKTLIPYLIGVLLLAACDVSFVDNPIPTDSKSLTEFPQKYQGIFSENSDKDSKEKIEILKDRIHYQSLCKGVMNKDSAELNSSFIKKGGKHYFLEDKFPVELTSYEVIDNSIHYSYLVKFDWIINSNLILKPVGKDLIVNLILPNEGNMSNWWIPFHLISENGNVCYSGLEEGRISNEFLILENDGRKFFQANWTEPVLLEMINQNCFGKREDYVNLNEVE